MGIISPQKLIIKYKIFASDMGIIGNADKKPGLIFMTDRDLDRLVKIRSSSHLFICLSWRSFVTAAVFRALLSYHCSKSFLCHSC